MVILVFEWEFEVGEQSFCFVVGFCSCCDVDVQFMQCVDFVVIDFGENDLFFYIDVVVVMVIESMI